MFPTPQAPKPLAALADFCGTPHEADAARGLGASSDTQGFYAAEDGPPPNWTQARYRRKVVWGAMQKVPLAVMVDKANENLMSKLPADLIEPTTGDADLDKLRSTLRDIAKAEKKAALRLEDLFDADKAKALRRKYVHVSFKHATGYWARMEGGKPVRRQFEG